jgi:hypothetical protein
VITDYREVLAQSAKDIVGQDNRCTAEPIYLVQQKKRLYGVDPRHRGRQRGRLVG